ncbi:DUF4097 family beta strand repeat-containing protein [Microbacterium luticocti]|uniref:DUF4097 family beta strand repeat-containing protein n=1 Tax=Microbacterium luticocti TaxID=451764 RepID=UPI0004117CD5|nr:DUF4097 family beta strand repeat-containing protein [Microbacterium luticocti]
MRTTPGATAIATLAIVVGGLVAVGSVTSAAASTLASASVHTSTRTADVAGVSALDAELGAGSLRVEYADVAEATLAVTSGSGADRWTLRRDGDELVVRTPQNGIWDWGWDGWFDHGSGQAVLQLPRRLEGMDATLDVSAGSLACRGGFGRLELSASAGQLTVDGSADALSVELSAGRAELTLSGVRTADLQISAGDMDATFSGAQPQRMTLAATAGSMKVTVPQGAYDVDADTSAGSFENRVGSTPGASSSVRVEVSAGRIVLQPSR